MRFERIVVCAAALAFFAPATAGAQQPAQPDYGRGGSSTEKSEELVASDDATEEKDEEEDDTPMGSVEPAEPQATAVTTETEAATVPPEPTETAAPVPDVEEVPPARERSVGVAWNSYAERGRDFPWTLDIGGYIRAGYTGIQNDESGTFGQHDGFVLGNARLSLLGRMRSLGFKFQIDGAVDQTESANDPNAIVDTRLKDAYLFWEPLSFVNVIAGQFKPPFDVEEQFSTSQILFVDRSVGSRGLSDVEGRNVEGLSVDRQVGAMIGSKPIFFLAEGDEDEGPGVSYGIAVTNGQNANRALNDNDKLAGYARAALHWGSLVSVGGAYAINPRTIGVQPDTIDENTSAWTADLVVDVVGLTVIGSVIGETISRPDLEGVEPETTGFAYQGQIAYREPFLGFQPAFRYAYFDPTERADTTDALTYITLGLNYVPDYPVRLLLNYTLTQESEELALRNNRFDAVLQVTW